MRVCGRCKQAPSAGKSFYCADCRREKHSEWRKKNPERWKQLARRAWQKRDKEKERARGREYWRRLRTECMDAYGGQVCACCGETEQTFLSIDHVNNDGAEHRRQLGYDENGKGASSATLRWLKKNNFPSGFQVLCMNCNHSKEVNGGICAHRLQLMRQSS